MMKRILCIAISADVQIGDVVQQKAMKEIKKQKKKERLKK